MNVSINQKQAKVLLRAATQLAKTTGLAPEKCVVVILKSIAQKVNMRNKG